MLLEIEDLAAVFNREIEEEEEPYLQYLIDSLTAFLEEELSLSFSVVTETWRYKADGWGIIELNGPVDDLEPITVAAVGSRSLYELWDGYYEFDGLDEISCLYPYQTVDITYTYGYLNAPQELKTVAAEMIKEQVYGPDSSELEARAVGDVSEKYRWTRSSWDESQKRILDGYRPSAHCWRL